MVFFLFSFVIITDVYFPQQKQKHKNMGSHDDVAYKEYHSPILYLH